MTKWKVWLLIALGILGSLVVWHCLAEMFGRQQPHQLDQLYLLRQHKNAR
jgi:hypothetical protein